MPNETCETCGDIGHINNEGVCQDCCPHDEHDHYICLDCGLETEPSDWYNEDGGLDR